MKDSVQSFTELLEKYVLSVADKFIELVDPESQTKLINLINKIDSSTPASRSIVPINSSPLDNLSEASPELSIELYTRRLEEQCQEALNQPTPQSQENAGYKNHKITIEYLIANHQANIDFTTCCVQRLDKLVDRAKENIIDTYRNTILINHYQSIKKRHIAYIAKLRTLQEKERIKLEQYQ